MAQAANFTAETLRNQAALYDKLQELLGKPTNRDDLRIESLADPLDKIKSELEREIAIHGFERRARLVREIQAALDAIHDGTYGLCESCDELIAPKRLQAIPWVRRCLKCQSDAES